MAELLDLDAEVLHSYLSEVTAWIQRAGRRPVPPPDPRPGQRDRHRHFRPA